MKNGQIQRVISAIPTRSLRWYWNWKDPPAAPGVVLREEEKLKAVFRGCDKNGDGVLDKDELREAFRRLGSVLPNWRAFWGMQLADANGDGLISEAELGELVKYAQKIGYTFHGYDAHDEDTTNKTNIKI